MIAYEPKSIAYFRQHEENTSASNFNKLYYYRELSKIFNHNAQAWNIGQNSKEKFKKNVEHQWSHFGMEKKWGLLEEKIPEFDLESLAHEEKTNIEVDHILIAFLGFHTGGGEFFPIHLANQLVKFGKTVSLLAFNLSQINDEMLEVLDSRVPIYSTDQIKFDGAKQFLSDVGADLIHSHMVSLEHLFFDSAEKLKDTPYIVSLHGSHNYFTDNDNAFLVNCLRGVTYWAYTAEKNLKIFDNLPLDPNVLRKFDNAMPQDDREFELSRKELGIKEDATIFVFVARGIQRKGWKASIEAFLRLTSEDSNANAHLLMVGDGEKQKEVQKLYEKVKNITFLGFQSRINGLFRMCDCVLLPTRFQGESFPLILIQAMLEGKPMIATDIGEIKNIIHKNGKKAGLLIPNLRNTGDFVGHLHEAMKKMNDRTILKSFSKTSKQLSKRFDMARVADDYLNLYVEAVAKHKYSDK